jgi:hypothetical protein
MERRDISPGQPRALDLRARGARRLERVPEAIVDDNLARVSALFA